MFSYLHAHFWKFSLLERHSSNVCRIINTSNPQLKVNYLHIFWSLTSNFRRNQAVSKKRSRTSFKSLSFLKYDIKFCRRIYNHFASWSPMFLHFFEFNVSKPNIHSVSHAFNSTIFYSFSQLYRKLKRSAMLKANWNNTDQKPWNARKCTSVSMKVAIFTSRYQFPKSLIN